VNVTLGSVHEGRPHKIAKIDPIPVRKMSALA